jgi:hypothetical protein
MFGISRKNDGRRHTIGRKIAAIAALSIGVMGGIVATAAPANASGSCSYLTWDGNDTNDVVGTCYVNSGTTLTIRLYCYSLPGYLSFVATKTLTYSQSFAWNTGCHRPFYYTGSLTVS